MAHSFKLRFVAVSVSIALAITPFQASANWMEDFYGSAGAAANITAPTAIMTQNVVGFSGGGVTWRVPNRTLNPVQITPPSLKMGCGGIDAFLGGYSFVNKDAFVNALRNFGQAAVGYFFQLALHSIAPEIAVTLDAINDMAQKVNQFGANSCQMAKLAVNSTAEYFGILNKGDASAYAQKVGQVVDYFDANVFHNTEGGSKVYENAYLAKYGKDKGSLTPEDVEQSTGVDINMLFWLIKNSKIDLTESELELVMSLIGAEFIVRAAPDDDGKTMPGADGHGSTITFKDLVGSPDEASRNLTVLKCASGNVECTQIVKSLEAHRTFTAIAQDTMSKLVAHIVARTPVTLSTEEQSVIKLSSIPLYRAASLSVSGGVVQQVSGEMMKDLAQYAALDAANHLLNHYSNTVTRAIQTSRGNLKGPLKDNAELLITRIEQIKSDASKVQKEVFEKRGDPWQKLKQLQEIERAAISNMNHHLAANQRFLNRH